MYWFYIFVFFTFVTYFVLIVMCQSYLKFTIWVVIIVYIFIIGTCIALYIITVSFVFRTIRPPVNALLLYSFLLNGSYDRFLIIYPETNNVTLTNIAKCEILWWPFAKISGATKAYKTTHLKTPYLIVWNALKLTKKFTFIESSSHLPVWECWSVKPNCSPPKP